MMGQLDEKIVLKQGFRTFAVKQFACGKGEKEYKRYTGQTAVRQQKRRVAITTTSIIPVKTVEKGCRVRRRQLVQA